MINKLERGNSDKQRKGKKGKKERFQEDVNDAYLRRSPKTKIDLFQRLDSIVQGYSTGDEEFLFLLQKVGAANSQNKDN